MVMFGPIPADTAQRHPAQRRSGRTVQESEIDVTRDEDTGRARREAVKGADDPERGEGRGETAELAQSGEVEQDEQKQDETRIHLLTRVEATARGQLAAKEICTWREAQPLPITGAQRPQVAHGPARADGGCGVVR